MESQTISMSDSINIIAKNNTSVPGLIVVCGPTASGKSGLAITLAQRLNTAIISADSRQVYREFDIGTAKPSPDEQKQVPHYLIDICDPIETLTVAEYQQQGQELIQGEGEGEGLGDRGQGSGVRGQDQFKILQPQTPSSSSSSPSAPRTPHPSSPSRTRTPHPSSPNFRFPLLVGGTGLYIKSIVRGMKIPRVPPQAELRSQLQQLGQPHCYAILQQVDPVSAEKIHPNDQVRTLRSLEVFYVTGRPMSEQQGEKPPTYPILQIGLDCLDTDALKRRIERRTEQMVEAGLVKEVETLCQKYGVELPLLNTLGYAEFKQYVLGAISLKEATDLTILHTRQFAKRQRTWFRADSEIEWFDADQPDLVDRVWCRVQEFICKKG